MSDGLINARARIAERITEVIESDRRVRRCKRIDFTNGGGALLAVELVPGSDAKSREAVARELEFFVGEAVPALRWTRVQVV
jgi:hypothetical protein